MSRISSMLRSSPEVLQGKRVQAGQDCLLLLQWLEATGTELRYGRQAELLEGSIRASNLSSRRTSPNRSRSTQQVWCSSPHDPDAQWSAKGRGKHRKSWAGY